MTKILSSIRNGPLEGLEEVDDHIERNEIWSDSNKSLCVEWIKQNNYKKVCLQFPDNYLLHSGAIYDSLQEICGLKLYILADTPYQNCCVDEISAAHIDADCVIHFGNVCGNKISPLPVLHVFPEFNISSKKMLEEFQNLEEISKGKSVFLYPDIGYNFVLEQLFESGLSEKIKQTLKATVVTIEKYPFTENKANKLKEDTKNQVCIFVGCYGNRFCNLSLASRAPQWFIYSPIEEKLCEQNSLKTNYIRRRYYNIEKCKNAQTLGLVLVTLTGMDYLHIISRIQKMAKHHGIKTQIISVGRINPAKLGNFLEIDCFVIIGCPFNKSYVSKDFYKPMVSVFEAEIALNPKWHMKYPESYVTDYKEILKSELDLRPQTAAEDNIGALNAENECRDICKIGKLELVEANTGVAYENRTWKGLSPDLGCTDPSKIFKGLSGIATSYNKN